MPHPSFEKSPLSGDRSHRTQGAIILLIVALCIERGVRRFEKAAILFDRPATTMAFPCKSAPIPLAATGRGFIVRRRSKGEAIAPAAASKAVAVCPGQ